MEKYISLKEKKEDEKKYQMECKKIEEENDSIIKNLEEIEIYDRKKTGKNYSYRIFFCTIENECFFEYYSYNDIKRFNKERTVFLSLLTDENKKKVYDFEHKMHEKYPEYLPKMKNKKVTYPKYENIKEYRISENYTVIFFTIGQHAIFRYFEDDGLTVYNEVERSCVLHWLSGEETERLFNFEDEIKEEYKKYIF